jgi:hypothetical protein
MFRMLGGFTGEDSLVHNGAVGARLIQASAHVPRGVGGGCCQTPPRSSLPGLYPGQWQFSCLGGEALHGTVLSLQSFWHHSQLSSFSSLCILPFIVIVPRAAINLGPVADLSEWTSFL